MFHLVSLSYFEISRNMVACPTDESFYHSYDLGIVMMVPFINLHTKLTVQVFMYFIHVAGQNAL